MTKFVTTKVRNLQYQPCGQRKVIICILEKQSKSVCTNTPVIFGDICSNGLVPSSLLIKISYFSCPPTTSNIQQLFHSAFSSLCLPCFLLPQYFPFHSWPSQSVIYPANKLTLFTGNLSERSSCADIGHCMHYFRYYFFSSLFLSLFFLRSSLFSQKQLA